MNRLGPYPRSVHKLKVLYMLVATNQIIAYGKKRRVSPL